MFASEVSYVSEKNVFRSIKLLSEPFSWTARIENGLLSNFSPISNNLLNQLLHKTIGEELLENSIITVCSSQKRLKTQFFGAKYIFLYFFASLSSLRRLHLAYSKLVRTPCNPICIKSVFFYSNSVSLRFITTLIFLFPRRYMMTHFCF